MRRYAAFGRQREAIPEGFLLVLAKRNPSDSKEKPLFVGAVEPCVGGVARVVIPKQDT